MLTCFFLSFRDRGEELLAVRDKDGKDKDCNGNASPHPLVFLDADDDADSVAASSAPVS